MGVKKVTQCQHPTSSSTRSPKKKSHPSPAGFAPRPGKSVVGTNARIFARSDAGESVSHIRHAFRIEAAISRISIAPMPSSAT